MSKKENKNIKNPQIKKKQKYFWMIIILIIILVFSLVFGAYSFLNIKKKISYYENEIAEIKKQNNKAFLNYSEIINYNEVWSYEKLVNSLINKDKLSKNTEIKIIVNDNPFDENDILTFDTMENKTIIIYLRKVYTYKILKEKTEVVEIKKEIILSPKDTVAPIIEGVSDKTIYVGDKINLTDGISANDDVDGEIEIQIEGEVDNTKAGTYKIKVIAEDKSGNKEEKEFNVMVKPKTNLSNNNNNSTNNDGNSNNNNNNSNNNNNNNAGGCTYTSLLQKRGYKSTDKNACQKDKEATAIIDQYASQINSKTYNSELEKVQAAANIVANNYDPFKHIESGDDYRTPYGVFVLHEASCAGTTRALIQLLEALGFTNLKHANPNSWTHQWVILTMDGKKGYADGQVAWVDYGCHIRDENCSE